VTSTPRLSFGLAGAPRRIVFRTPPTHRSTEVRLDYAYPPQCDNNNSLYFFPSSLFTQRHAYSLTALNRLESSDQPMTFSVVEHSPQSTPPFLTFSQPDQSARYLYYSKRTAYPMGPYRNPRFLSTFCQIGTCSDDQGFFYHEGFDGQL